MLRSLSIASWWMKLSFDIQFICEDIAVLISRMHFKIQNMQKKGITVVGKVEKAKKVMDTHEQMKLLEKIEGTLKLQTKIYLIDHLETIFFGKMDQKKKRGIYHLLDIWKHSSDLKDAITLSSKTLAEDHSLYRQNQILSARVYMKMLQYFSFKDCVQLFNMLRQMKLTFSYDRYWWKNEVIGYNWDSNELQSKKQKSQIISKIMEQVKHFKNEFLNKLFSFLEKIGLLFTCKQGKNIFMIKMERITSVIQREIYLKSTCLPILEIIKCQKVKGKQKQKQLIAYNVKKQLPNYYYYTALQKKNIDQLHLKYKQYQYLEQAHDYVQWMFPNHFKSIFNEDSYPLNYVQSHLFHSNLMIGLKILKSILIFLDFWGIFFDISTFKLEIVSLERLEAVLVYRTHNLLRLKRILAFLSVNGFREVALALIHFLLEKTSQIKDLKQAHSEMVENEQKYGLNKLNHDKQAKISCRLQLQQFPSKHAIFPKIQQLLKKQTK